MCVSLGFNDRIVYLEKLKASRKPLIYVQSQQASH